MRKMLIFVLTVSILLLCCGCGGDAGHVGIDMEIDPSACSRSSMRRMAETENGYYAQFFSLLFYADKSDLSNWVPVCNLPACGHDDEACPASCGETFFVEGDRIYTLRRTLGFDTDSDECRHGIFSMALDGTDLRLETKIKCRASDEGGTSYSVLLGPDLACACYSFLQSDGRFLNQLLLTDKGETTVLAESTTDESITTSLVGTFSLRGDWVGASEMLSGPGRYMERLYRVGDGTLAEVEGLRGYNLSSAYLEGDLLYHADGDGYYVTDLSVGTSKKRADIQLADSVAYHLSGEVIVESNIVGNTLPAEPGIKIFNGSHWGTVTLSKAIAKEGFPYCFPYAMSTEYIFFIGERQDGQDYRQVLYCVSLMDENYTLSPCGEFGIMN